jgi:hypothetical protein
MTTHVNGLVLAAVLSLFACGGEPQPENGAEQMEISADTTRLPAMPMPMMDEMRAHMGAMQGLPAESLRVMMPAHGRMADSMFAEMNRHMQSMNMPRAGELGALMDSLRDDMTRMREMSGAELTDAMAAHMARMRRMMEAQGGAVPTPD